MGISRIFDIASRSLGVYQRALDITSHNVANANNADYARQRVIFGSERAEATVGGEFGAGVKIDDIARIKDSLTDLQIRNYNQAYSNSSKRSEVLGQVETLFSEPSDLGLSSLISSFYNSWDELASSPNSTPLRNGVIQAADKLSNKVKDVYEGLNLLKTDLNSQVSEKVEELNSTIQDIQDLNRQIKESKVINQPVNDLLDRRDKKIDDLSKLTNINVHTDDQGSVSISIGGVFAVDEYSSTKFKVNSTNGKLSLTTQDGSVTTSLNGGELYASMDLYNNQISSYQDSVNSIAQNIMDSVNAVHRQGYGLNNYHGDFFTGYSNGVLSFTHDTNDIAASDAINNAGNSNNAIAIAKLADSKLIDGKSIGEYYNSFISGIGTQKKLNEQSSDANQLVLDQLNNQKASYSGVSIDEEMTNVIKFQKSYDASAKLIKVADEMLQTLLNMV
ncbi:MAG: flagellar hook-associated protein FlgK [Ignavibacteria bacterium]|jgi:flagellar hook-associated protein 1 FlgK|nr:flagellar hook-associated protein FlgK [Ignavibacteria bacterium]MCU7501929.1 flagellar hook-associated protein FlgK [Ignavibacteria bacterium]MCU7514725.1 flagellar hook-associated protein FlgK [Ignavibacteria bacterium]